MFYGSKSLLSLFKIATQGKCEKFRATFFVSLSNKNRLIPTWSGTSGGFSNPGGRIQ